MLLVMYVLQLQLVVQVAAVLDSVAVLPRSAHQSCFGLSWRTMLLSQTLQAACRSYSRAFLLAIQYTTADRAHVVVPDYMGCVWGSCCFTWCVIPIGLSL